MTRRGLHSIVWEASKVPTQFWGEDTAHIEYIEAVQDPRVILELLEELDRLTVEKPYIPPQHRGEK